MANNKAVSIDILLPNVDQVNYANFSSSFCTTLFSVSSEISGTVALATVKYERIGILA